MTNDSIDFNTSSQRERDDWYASRIIPCLGSEDNQEDRCGWIKRKFRDWGLDKSEPCILDFPCHDGFVTRGFLGYGASIHGFDIGIDAIDKANEVAFQNHPGKSWEYECCGIEEFNWSDQGAAYDLVVCFEFIEHIPFDDVSKLLIKMNYVTDSGGYVAISTPQKFGKYGVNGDDKSHINLYTPHDLASQVNQFIGVEPEIEDTEDFIFCSWRKE